MNALANEQVGNYVNEHFVTAFQKVGTFRVVNGAKQGGNVAAYFCLNDFTVVHAVAGPVQADEFLREARWAVETRKLALMESKGKRNPRYEAVVLKAHEERLRQEHGVSVPSSRRRGGYSNVLWMRPPAMEFGGASLSKQGKVHYLLADQPGLVTLDQVYRTVFERILGEMVSSRPVVVR